MSPLPHPLEVSAIPVSGGNLTLVAIVLVVALLALVMAFVFRREVLAANEGTENMQLIARGVQEGASAFLGRQFRTLSVFAVVAFFLLLALPARGSDEFSETLLRISRSVAFLAGAVFSALIGYLGMWLAVRANLRVAAAATRRFARVASAMPAPPMKELKTAPTMKNNDRPILTAVSLSVSCTGSRNSSTTATTTKMARVLNWRNR